MANFENKRGGLIKMIIVIVIAIAILSWYGFDLKDFFTSPQAKANYSYVWGVITDIWTNYLAIPAGKLLDLWVAYIWDPFLAILKIGDHTSVLTK